MKNKSGKIIFIIDFDSTFIRLEALDELFKISLKDNPDKKELISRFEEITKMSMDGKLSFSESLSKRTELLNADRSHIETLAVKLSSKVSGSVKRNKAFFKKFGQNIYIISGGFKELIIPIAGKYNIPEENVHANTFIFDKKGKITGFDKHNLLSQNSGKIKLLKKLRLEGDLYVIGDGYTDYELKKAGIAHKFFAFTENIDREIVSAKADHITPSMDEFLFINKLPMSISYPKNRIKVLLLENIHSDAMDIFKKEGYQIETAAKSLNKKELLEKIKDVSILGIRSKTHIDEEIIQKAGRLISIGAFCIGTNQIDLNSALTKGIAVFNAPFSNTRSVVELALAEMIILMRNIIDKNNSLHQGIWEKSAKGSFEIRGKKIGIIGYGKIGSQLSVLAESLGMEVLYYDVIDKLALGNARKCSTLSELLKKSDVITLHVDGNRNNADFIGEKEFKQMKTGVIFLNLSRGHVVDLKSLVTNIRSGKISGASIDVYPEEPSGNDEKFISELQGLPNVILTPHIGGSTEEAQKNIANFVPEKIIDFINSGNTFYSVNFPEIQLPQFQNAHRLIHIHENMPGILASINNVLAGHNINIIGQYLKTNEHVGYVITDISKKYDPQVINDLKKIRHTIKFRVLY
ncbi:MAG TPA: phosphoglycerate dehydrogenase [Ignavibacteria bacterium]|nr:phosphoglycerate dehydrogenase [Ignavibacteria bacterium]HMR40476.1 phosphoglycerate dehydrogenase [Ignavibacteria bacterium]